MLSSPGPLALVLFQVGAILVTARLFGLLARRLGQPQVVAEIVAGVALGPSLLGLLSPTAMHALFAEGSLAGVKVLSQLGLVLFMFLVGLELEREHLKTHLRAVLGAAAGSTALTALFGVGAGVLLFTQYRGPAASQATFVAFMALAMSVTALPVLARILSEQKLEKTRLGTLALACAGIKDLALWCALPFLVAFSGAGSMRSALLTAALGALFLLGVLVVPRPLLARLELAVDSGKVSENSALGAVVGGLLFSAGLAEWIGIHALVGAFLYGAVMPRRGLFRSTLKWKLEPVVVSVLLPLFFAWSGLRTQVGLLTGLGDWGVFAALVGFASFGAMAGGTLAARASGLSWRDSGSLGVLLNTRGLMELVVLNIGLDLGLLSPALFTVMVLVALATTVATTPLLRWLQRGAPREAAAESALPAVPGVPGVDVGAVGAQTAATDARATPKTPTHPRSARA